MTRGRAAARVLPCVVVVLALATPSVLSVLLLQAPAEPAGSSLPRSCAEAGARPSVAPGVPEMAIENWAVRVVNTSQAACVLPGYPTVRFEEAAGSSVPLAVYLLARPLGLPAPTAPVTPRLVLRAGQTASAQLSDFPNTGMPTCRRVHAVVTLTGGPGTVPSAHVRVCSAAVDVSPFVLGFDGTTTGGEVVGTAPACPWTSSEQHRQLGPVVHVDVWSGTKLATSVDVPGAPTATKPYQFVLRPGPYRITAPGETARRITVRPGFATGLGPYGRCSGTSASVPTTVPGPGRTSPTTSTTTTTS